MRVPKIAVVGSLNIDLVMRCERLPSPGETIMTDDVLTVPGGKGANQAVAAARAGGEVSMIGRIGDDAYAPILINNLRQQKVITNQIHMTPLKSSGVAVVAVDSNGQNAIMVSPGSNATLSPEDIDDAADVIRDAELLMIQLETPMETVLHAIQIAKQTDTRTLLDPAPAPSKPTPSNLFSVDFLCPNQSEAAALTGITIRSQEDAFRAAFDLQKRGVQTVMITLAEKGVVLLDNDGPRVIPPLQVKPVDTTAAGDAFAGAFAVRVVESDSTDDAAYFAATAGAMSTTTHGAQPSLPTRKEILENCPTSNQ